MKIQRRRIFEGERAGVELGDLELSVDCVMRRELGAKTNALQSIDEAVDKRREEVKIKIFIHLEYFLI